MYATGAGSVATMACQGSAASSSLIKPRPARRKTSATSGSNQPPARLLHHRECRVRPVGGQEECGLGGDLADPGRPR